VTTAHRYRASNAFAFYSLLYSSFTRGVKYIGTHKNLLLSVFPLYAATHA
jgi:hypothetical protein